MSNVFKSEDYLKDKEKFFFVDSNKSLDTAVVRTDDECYVAVQGNVNLPVWVWTKESLSLDKLKELRDVLTKYLGADSADFTSRKEVYEYLLNTGYPYLDKDSYFELGFLSCTNPVKPKECDGFLDRVREDEYELLCKYNYLCHKEMSTSDYTEEEAREKSLELLNSDNFYVWRNSSGKLVAFLNYRVQDTTAKLANVYTVLDERRKGYCANLVYNVTKLLLDKGLLPLLYTDYNYVNSNEAYKKVGYEDHGYLVNYTLKRKKL